MCHTAEKQFLHWQLCQFRHVTLAIFSFGGKHFGLNFGRKYPHSPSILDKCLLWMWHWRTNTEANTVTANSKIRRTLVALIAKFYIDNFPHNRSLATRRELPLIGWHGATWAPSNLPVSCPRLCPDCALTGAAIISPWLISHSFPQQPDRCPLTSGHLSALRR